MKVRIYKVNSGFVRIEDINPFTIRASARKDDNFDADGWVLVGVFGTTYIKEYDIINYIENHVEI